MKVWLLACLALPALASANEPFLPTNLDNQSYASAQQCVQLAPHLVPRPATEAEQQLRQAKWWVGPRLAREGELEVRQAVGLLNDRCGLDSQQWFVFRAGRYEGALLPQPQPFEQAPRNATVENGVITLEWVDENDRPNRWVRYVHAGGQWVAQP